MQSVFRAANCPEKSMTEGGKKGFGREFAVTTTKRFPSFIKLEIVDNAKQKNLLQNKKLANAPNRRATEIYGPENGALSQ